MFSRSKEGHCSMFMLPLCERQVAEAGMETKLVFIRRVSEKYTLRISEESNESVLLAESMSNRDKYLAVDAGTFR